MRSIYIASILLIICLVCSCNKGTTNSSFGSTITYPKDWPSFLVLPSNCKPYRTRHVGRLANEGESNYVSPKKIQFGFNQIGFEYPDGWDQLISHFDNILSGKSYVVTDDKNGRVKDYKWNSVDIKSNGISIFKESRSKNYYTITYWWK